MIAVNPKEIEKLVELMVKYRVIRAKLDGLELELSPDAWNTRPPAPVENIGEALGKLPVTLCPCGHDLDTEHSDAGCLHGCLDSLCHSKDGEEPKS
jgi:hypothetical protein